MQRNRHDYIRLLQRVVLKVLLRQNAKGCKDMHFTPVFEHLEGFCHRRLVTHNGPGLFEVPASLQTAAAEMIGPVCLCKRLTAHAAEGF
jgi:hypothetical protein